MIEPWVVLSLISRNPMVEPQVNKNPVEIKIALVDHIILLMTSQNTTFTRHLPQIHLAEKPTYSTFDNTQFLVPY